MNNVSLVLATVFLGIIASAQLFGADWTIDLLRTASIVGGGLAFFILLYMFLMAFFSLLMKAHWLPLASVGYLGVGLTALIFGVILFPWIAIKDSSHRRDDLFENILFIIYMTLIGATTTGVSIAIIGFVVGAWRIP